MNVNWTKADAWYRRDTDEGGYLTVSRAGNGTWSWFWRVSRTGGVFGQGGGHESHLEAMIEADRSSARMCEIAS